MDFGGAAMKEHIGELAMIRHTDSCLEGQRCGHPAACCTCDTADRAHADYRALKDCHEAYARETALRYTPAGTYVHRTLGRAQEALEEMHTFIKEELYDDHGDFCQGCASEDGP